MSLAETIIYSTDDNAVSEILAGADVNESDRYGFRPLIEAVICRKPKTLRALIAAGANIDQQDFIKRTALQWAVDRGELEYCKILLEAGANPNHYSADGQPILVNAILRQQLEFVALFQQHNVDLQFAEDFISAKLLGHRFELTGEADIVSPSGSFIPLSFEGFNLEFTTGLIHRSLYNFINSMPGQKYSKFFGRLTTILETLRNASQLTDVVKHKDKTPFKQMIEILLENELLLLPAAYEGHAITFAKYGDLWAKCDRGVGVIANTVVISEIHNPYAANKELFEKILYGHKSKDFVSEDIAKELNLRTLMTLPSRHQITGNCSWANVETSIPTMLFLLSYNPQVHTTMGEMTDLQKDIYQFYKAWVDWDHDTALDEALADFNAADNTRRLSKAIILGSILVQRCDPKHSLNIARAKKILSILTQPEYSFILDNYCKVYFSPNSGVAGDMIQRLFKTCGLNIEELKLKKSVRYDKSNIQTENLVRMTTALHVASLQGDLAAVKKLVEELKLDVNYVDRTGSTALMYAAYAGYPEIVKYLIAHGAQTEIRNLKGGTALRYAQYAGRNDIVAYLISTR